MLVAVFCVLGPFWVAGWLSLIRQTVGAVLFVSGGFCLHKRASVHNAQLLGRKSVGFEINEKLHICKKYLQTLKFIQRYNNLIDQL